MAALGMKTGGHESGPVISAEAVVQSSPDVAPGAAPSALPGDLLELQTCTPLPDPWNWTLV